LDQGSLADDVGAPATAQLAGAPAEQPRRVHVHAHPADHPLHELVLRKWRAELAAGAGVVERRVEARLRQPDAAPGEVVSAGVEARRGDVRQSKAGTS